MAKQKEEQTKREKRNVSRGQEQAGKRRENARPHAKNENGRQKKPNKRRDDRAGAVVPGKAAGDKRERISERANDARKRTLRRKETPRRERSGRGFDGTLRIIPLGGLGEIGKNMTAIEYGEDIVVIDCGLAFPDEDMPGVDLVIPDVSYLVKNQARLRGILLTHGHEDHIGAIPYVLQQIRTPIYGTRLTVGIVRNKLGRKDYQGVLETVEPYLAENPDDMRLLPSKGLALYKLKEYKQSADVFEHLKALGDTLSYGTRFFLGQDYSELNVIYRAKRELEAAWQIDSSDVELALAIASVNSRGHYSFREEVLPWYDKAHAMLQPDPVLSARVFQGYATGFFRQNDWAQALVWYKKAYESNPAQKYFLSSIAYCYEQLKDYRTALSYYEEYLKAAKPGSSNYRFEEESVRYLKGELFMQEPPAPTP